MWLASPGAVAVDLARGTLRSLPVHAIHKKYVLERFSAAPAGGRVVDYSERTKA
jgi:hypothetical protein